MLGFELQIKCQAAWAKHRWNGPFCVDRNEINQNLSQPKVNTYQKNICIWFEMILLWYPGVNKFGDGGGAFRRH